MTYVELDEMWSIAALKSIEENQPYTRYLFARMVAAKYEQKIQDLEDIITELQERQE